MVALVFKQDSGVSEARRERVLAAAAELTQKQAAFAAKMLAKYKRQLGERYGIAFNRLYTLANMPIQRFGSTGRMISAMTASRSFFVEMSSLCCVDSTTASMPTGLSFS